MDCSLCDTLRHVTNICCFFESAVCSAEDLTAYQRLTGDTEPVKPENMPIFYIHSMLLSLLLQQLVVSSGAFPHFYIPRLNVYPWQNQYLRTNIITHFPQQLEMQT